MASNRNVALVLGSETMIYLFTYLLLIVVFPNIPTAPGQPCTGEDRKFYFCGFVKFHTG